MPEISKIKLPDNQDYEIKDAKLRNDLDILLGRVKPEEDNKIEKE